MLDGWYNKFPANKKKLNLPNTVENLQVEQWLYYFKNSDFVITDSFHGTCIAILFNKPFIAIGNPARGSSRFESLLGAFNLWNRYAERPEDILKNDAFLKPVDYAPVNAAIEAQRKTSLAWLKTPWNRKAETSSFPSAIVQKAGLAGKSPAGSIW
ncbi:MAG: polysaccharide pyruvyl transferase family protein [Blautia sp.]